MGLPPIATLVIALAVLVSDGGDDQGCSQRGTPRLSKNTLIRANVSNCLAGLFQGHRTILVRSHRWAASPVWFGGPEEDIQGRELSSSSQQQQTPVDFDCPEEFGYYAHPTDCTQYYVCVFGGALLESCTGGLMYSHELQTCDWPRNVGCAPGQQQALQQQEIGHDSRQQLRQDARQQELRQELARHELRQQEARQELRQQEARQELRQQEARQELRQQEARQELRQQEARQGLRQQELRQQEAARHELRPEYRQVQEALRQPKQQQQQIIQQVVDNRGRQRAPITVPKADLYNTEEEELGPAVEELEIDRQQRVYRGQPSTLGQVASDRDGLTHSNAIPVPATGGRDKLSVISYGAQQQYNSLNKRKRTDGITDSDHNFLTNSPRVRMKRDNYPSYQQSLGPRSFLRKNKKHNRRKREKPSEKISEMVVGNNKNNSVNDTATSSTSDSQDHKEITSQKNNDEIAKEEEEEVEEEEDEEEEEGEESEDDQDEEEDEEENDNSEEEQSEEDNNEEDKNSKNSLEKPASGMESNETNKSTSYNDFKLDFPSPPSSWESFEDFKGSFDDIDFDVEKFLEDLKTDSFDDDIFGSKKKSNQQLLNNQQTEQARSAMKSGAIPLIIIPPSINATEVKFELFFPKPITNNSSLSNVSSILPTSTEATPPTNNDYIEKTLTVPATSTTFTTHHPLSPSSEFSRYQDSLKHISERSDGEQLVNNRRSHNDQMPRPRPVGRMSHGQIRRNSWRGKVNIRERKPARVANRGSARFTLKSPRYFVMNTTPNYNSETHLENVNPTAIYGIKNPQLEITPTFTGQNAKPTNFKDNQEYRYSYATHYNSALHKPNTNNNDAKVFEATTPRQTYESDRVESTRHSDRGRQIAYNLYERSPDYRQRMQNLYRRQNQGYKFYRPGGKNENLIGPRSTIQPIVVRNPNSFENMDNGPIYTGRFSSGTIVDHNEAGEQITDFAINSQPTNIPSHEIQSTQQLSTMQQAVPTPYFENGKSHSREELYHPETAERESHTTESTFIYDQQIEINSNENWLPINHSRHDISPYYTKTNYGASVTYPNPSHNTEPSYPNSKYTSKSNRDDYNKIQDSIEDDKHDSDERNKPSSSIPFRKPNATVAYPNTENYHSIDMNDQLNPTTSYQVNIQQQYPQNHKIIHSTKSDLSAESLEENHGGYKTNFSGTEEKPSSYFYVNQKIGPVKKIAIFNNIPSDESSDDDYDYYNDYDEDDYEDVSNETTPKPPKIPKTLQNIDDQEFEDPEYDEYNDEETDYEEESKEKSGNEMSSAEDYYDDEEEKEDIKEGETKNVKVEAKSQEGSMERPLTVTPRPGCIFAGRAVNGQKRLLCPRRNSTDRPNTTADDQTNSEQTRRTITLFRASVQPVQQQPYDTRGYNTTRYIQQQQQQYTDPNYYSVYDEEAEQYKDIADYAQYIQQNKQDIYTRKKPSVEIVQQEPVQRGAAFQKNKYSTQPENIYQSVTPQEYDTYSIQNNDDLYRQVQTKPSTRFPEVKELGSTQGERRLITLSPKLTNNPLPTDTPTKTDRVGSGFRLENTQTEANVVNITPRKRGQTDTQTKPTASIVEKTGSLAQQVNSLAPSGFILDPVTKVLDILTKSGEYLSDEASVEESREINHVATGGSHRRKSPLTVEEIDIDHLKNINFQSTPASRFKVATASPETPYIQPVVAINNAGISQSFVQSSTRPPPTPAPTAIPSVSKAVEQDQQTRKTYETPNKDNYSTEKKFMVTSTREQPRQQTSKQDYSTRSRGTVRHHNSGEIFYTDPGSAQDYSDQLSSLEIPKEWRNLPVITKERDSSQWSKEQTTKDPEIFVAKQQPRFRPVTTDTLQGLTTEIPPRKVESSYFPETKTQKKIAENIQPTAYSISHPNHKPEQSTTNSPVKFESTTQQLRIIGMRASFSTPSDKENERTTPKHLLIRIPETLKAREETARKLEVPSIKVNTYRGNSEREQTYRETELSRDNSETTSKEPQKPIAIRIPDSSTRSRNTENSPDILSSRKQYIKAREREEAEYEKEKPTPIRYTDSMEFDRRSKETRGSNRLRDSGRDTINSYDNESSRRQQLRTREYINTVTAPESSTELQNLQPKTPNIPQSDSRQRENFNIRSREQLNTEVAKPIAIRVPNSNAQDQHQYKNKNEGESLKADEVMRGQSRDEEANHKRGELRGRGRLTDPLNMDRNTEITNRFEVPTTLRPNYRLTASSITSKPILSRPPKKFRNGTIYADQTLPIGTDMTDSPHSAEPDTSIRARPMSNNNPSTPGSTRNNVRHRGSQTYTVSPNEAEPAPAPVVTSPPRGTLPPNRGRPTLKPSNSVVSKAAEFVDIYRFPPTRPENVYPTPQVDKTAAKCRKDVCLLPDCYCGGKDVPGELTPEETPQIVLLTFDDSVNDLNKGLYSDLFDKGRVNPNGCPISATFYVSHEWTDYSQVQNLYAGGHEIASHSVSHSFGEQFSQKKWTREIAGQREILAAYGGVKLEDIRGMRAPFLAVGGNKMFKMLYDSNFTYDSSMPVYENRPPSWPYTLDYKVFHDCMIPPCPTKSYPGIWEVPMVMWQDLNGGRCSMGDACSNPPTADGVYKMLIKNFERHFTTNRAPFGLFYHAAWFTQPHHKEGFISFLDTINKMPEVWLITNWQAIQWVRDPTPLSRLGSFAPFQCNYHDRPKKCNNPKVCNLWHKSGVRYMRTCQVCPDIYPWTGKSGVRNSRVDNDLE